MTFLQGIYVPRHLRMIKGGSNQNGVGNSYNLVTNMVVAPGFPEDDVINGAIVIDYDAEPYTAIVTGRVSWSGGTFPSVGCRIIRNAETLVTGPHVSSGDAVATTTITVNPGDTFLMHWRGDGSFFIRPTLNAGSGTYLDILPS